MSWGAWFHVPNATLLPRLKKVNGKRDLHGNCLVLHLEVNLRNSLYAGNKTCHEGIHYGSAQGFSVEGEGADPPVGSNIRFCKFFKIKRTKSQNVESPRAANDHTLSF